MLIQAGQVPEHILRCVSLPGEQQLLSGFVCAKQKLQMTLLPKEDLSGEWKWKISLISLIKCPGME